jgi:hypothetical protein
LLLVDVVATSFKKNVDIVNQSKVLEADDRLMSAGKRSYLFR